MSEKRIEYNGSLDMSSVPQLVETVEIAAHKHRRIILDMTNLDFVDSTGIHGLITLRQKMTAEGRELLFEGFRPEILDILDILGIREMILGG